MAIFRTGHDQGCPAVYAWDIPNACNCGQLIVWCTICGVEAVDMGEEYECPECRERANESEIVDA